MFNQSRKLAGKLSTNLLKLDKEPIRVAALIVIAFLDLFILVSIFDGLSEQTRQLVHPNEYIPQHCRDIVLDGDWNKTLKLQLDADFFIQHSHQTTIAGLQNV